MRGHGREWFALIVRFTSEPIKSISSSDPLRTAPKARLLTSAKFHCNFLSSLGPHGERDLRFIWWIKEDMGGSVRIHKCTMWMHVPNVICAHIEKWTRCICVIESKKILRTAINWISFHTLSLRLYRRLITPFLLEEGSLPAFDQLKYLFIGSDCSNYNWRSLFIIIQTYIMFLLTLRFTVHQIQRPLPFNEHALCNEDSQYNECTIK